MAQKQIPRIKPTQKDRWRYVAFKVEGQQASDHEVRQKIENSVRHLLGAEAYKAKTKLLEYSPNANFGIVRCSHTHALKVRDAVNSAGLKTLHTSGTIRKLREKTAAKG